MITPIEIQSRSFKSGIGYDKKDVDNFLNMLRVDYENMYKEKMELNDKLNVLQEGINYYKTIEKTLQKALVLAEQTAEDTREAAKQQARAIIGEAKGKAQLIVADANNELEQLHRQTLQLIRQYDTYKVQFKHLAAAQCELLESDSFQIHIANLEAFLVQENEQKSAVEESSNLESTTLDEDFEFFDLNQNEQE